MYEFPAYIETALLLSHNLAMYSSVELSSSVEDHPVTQWPTCASIAFSCRTAAEFV
jgi:hypothetical protein